MRSPKDPYYRHRFPGEIISYCVWLYFRMTVSVRDVEEIMAMRGIAVSYEAIRKWARKFGQQYANQLRQRRPRPGDKWHLDEVAIKINRQKHYVWRAVDQKGNCAGHLGAAKKEQESGQEVLS